MHNVYGMVDPRDKSYFYVGCTSRSTGERGYEHILEALRNTTNSLKNRRILEIIEECRTYPYPVHLEYVRDEALWREREVYWIWKLAHEGHCLTNRQWNKYAPIRWWSDR